MNSLLRKSRFTQVLSDSDEITVYPDRSESEETPQVLVTASISARSTIQSELITAGLRHVPHASVKFLNGCAVYNPDFKLRRCGGTL